MLLAWQTSAQTAGMFATGTVHNWLMAHLPAGFQSPQAGVAAEQLLDVPAQPEVPVRTEYFAPLAVAESHWYSVATVVVPQAVPIAANWPLPSQHVVPGLHTGTGVQVPGSVEMGTSHFSLLSQLWMTVHGVHTPLPPHLPSVPQLAYWVRVPTPPPVSLLAAPLMHVYSVKSAVLPQSVVAEAGVWMQLPLLTSQLSTVHKSPSSQPMSLRHPGVALPEQLGNCDFSGFLLHSDPAGQVATGFHSVQLKFAVLPLHAAVTLPSQPSTARRP